MKVLLMLCALLTPIFASAGAYEEMEEALTRHDASAVIKLVERGMDVNTVDRQGNTLLVQAVRADMPTLVDYLLQHKARLNSRNRYGETAIGIAAFMGKMRYVQQFVEAGAEVNFFGWTPLAYAAFNGHAQIVDYLLKHGAKIDAKTETGTTALHLAARNGHVEVVKILLNNNADPMIGNENNQTAVDFALKSGNATVLNLLREAGGHSGKTMVIDLSK